MRHCSILIISRGGLSLYYSLIKECKQIPITIYVLALDSQTEIYFSQHPKKNLIIISLKEVELEFPELNIAKINRSKIEYYFTLSPVLPLYILQKYPNVSRITTLDADIYFYSNPVKIFEKYHENSVLITPHDFSPELTHLNQYGKYNVSFQSFPNTDNGIVILKDWKAKCLNWCRDYIDPQTGFFADQKYLDDWVNNFDNVIPIDMKCCNRAPWNISNTKLLYSGKTFLVEDQPLIYFHFHHLRINKLYVGHGLQDFGIYDVQKAFKKLYSKYIKSIQRQNKKLLLQNDEGIIRDKEFTDQWQKEIGAIFIFNRVFFYNIIKFKSKFKSILASFKWQM